MHRLFPSRNLLAFLLTFSLLTGCRSPQVTSENITISISADGASRKITVTDPKIAPKLVKLRNAGGMTYARALPAALAGIGSSVTSHRPAASAM